MTTTPVAEPGSRPNPPRQQGSSLVELLLVLMAMMLVGAIATPTLGQRGRTVELSGSARYLSSLLQRARTEAIRRGTYVAYRFTAVNGQVRYAMFADGNGNGVRSVDITLGVDGQVSAWESVADHFAGVTFSIAPGVTDIDTGTPLAGDPVRIGGSELLSFSPTGTATSGTLYLSDRNQQQWAVRVLGATGRIRVLRFDPGNTQWTSP